MTSESKDLFFYFYFLNMDIMSCNVEDTHFKSDIWFDNIYPEGTQFFMRWIFMYKVLKTCKPSHSNEPVHFWIVFNWWEWLVSLGLLSPHWIIQLVIDRNAIEISRRHMDPILSSDLRSRAKRRSWTKCKIDFCFLCMNLLIIDSSLKFVVLQTIKIHA